MSDIIRNTWHNELLNGIHGPVYGPLIGPVYEPVQSTIRKTDCRCLVLSSKVTVMLVNNILTCRQHELSPKSVTNIDLLEIHGPVHGQLYASVHSPFQGPDSSVKSTVRNRACLTLVR